MILLKSLSATCPEWNASAAANLSSKSPSHMLTFSWFKYASSAFFSTAYSDFICPLAMCGRVGNSHSSFLL